MRTPALLPLAAFTALCASALLVFGSIEATAQTLASDLPDYPPGTTATLTGMGFLPGEQVRMQVVHADGLLDSGADHLPWTVVADSSGVFVTTWDVCTDDCVGATLRATADGLSSGQHAECLFTDATAWTVTMAPTSSTAGQTQSYVLTALNTSSGIGNPMGCITITLPAAFTPSGSPSVVSGSTTHSWTVSLSGQVVTATANSSSDRLNSGESIQIEIAATAPSSLAGSPFTWVAVARTNTNCTGSSFGVPDGNQPTVSVLCAPPGIACPANISVNNDPGVCGATVSFSATATGDPAPAVSYSRDPGTVFPVGTTTVTATATSACGSASGSFTVTVVDNTPPAITLAGPSSMTLECHGPAFSDPGASAADNCAGSLPVSVSGSVDVNAVGDYVLTYSATDPSGNSDSKTRTVHVVDTSKPTVTLVGGDLTLECHGAAFSDPGASADDACAGSLPVSVSGSVDVNAVGDYVLTYSATDPSGNSDSKTRTVHVVDTTPPAIGDPGASATIQCPNVPSFTAPTASDACDGNAQVIEVSDVTVPGACAGAAVRTKTWKAVDASGNSSATVSQTITIVDTTAPTIGAAGASVTISCPATPAFTAPTASDGCDSNPQVIEISDVTTPGSCPGAYSRTKTWQAKDCSGNLSAPVSQTISVVDVTAPVAAITGPASGTVVSTGVPVTFTGVASDACNLQGAQWQFDSIVVPAGPIGAGGAVSTTYTFTQAGIYQVKLIATDACGNIGTASQTADGYDWTVIVFDPNGGFVTGGGWINSPAGAYRPNPALVGKANFGFVSKYQRGAKVPTGETEFQFKAGNLDFHSIAYEWLVIAGAKAQYKGTGSLNGAAGYGFLLTGVDGNLLGGSQPDRFRVKIWDQVTGGVIYDNQYGQPDDSDASTALGGGSIVVQSGGASGKGYQLPAAAGASVTPVTSASLPLEFALHGAQPNPFIGGTQIGFDLPEPSEVSLLVYDVRGRRLATLSSGQFDPGAHLAHWNGHADSGEELKAGVYFVRFVARSAVSARRVESVQKVLLKQ